MNEFRKLKSKISPQSPVDLGTRQMRKWWPVGLVLLWVDGYFLVLLGWLHLERMKPLGTGVPSPMKPPGQDAWVAVGAPTRAERKEDRQVPGASLLFLLLGAVGRSAPVGSFRLLLSDGGRLKRIRLVGLTKWLWLTLARFGTFFSFQRVLCDWSR